MLLFLSRVFFGIGGGERAFHPPEKEKNAALARERGAVEAEAREHGVGAYPQRQERFACVVFDKLEFSRFRVSSLSDSGKDRECSGESPLSA